MNSLEDHLCDLCESTDKTLLFDKDRFGNDVHNYICENCGYVYVLPRPNMEELLSYYETGGFSIDGRNSALPSPKKIKHSEKYALDRIKLLEKNGFFTHDNPRSTLEIGCGIGSFLFYLRALGWEVEGIEPDTAFAKYGNDLYNLDIQDSDIESFNSKQKYDLISSFHVIEHVIDPNYFLSKIHSLLKDDGHLFIECPSIDHLYGKNVSDFFWNVHINTFSNKTLREFLEKNGFEIIKYTHFKGFVNYLAKRVEKKQGAVILPFDFNKTVHNVKNYTPTLRQKITKKYATLISNNSLGEIREKSLQEVRKKFVFKKINYLSNMPNVNLGKKPSILHVGFHSSNNAGDIVLFKSIERYFHDKFGAHSYSRFNLHKTITKDNVKLLNNHDLIVIGGGGLFLKDTNENSTSGWQWPCSIEMLHKIKTSIALYAIGYNKFRGHDDFDNVFYDNLKVLTDKVSFFGVRNKGSIKKIKASLENHSSKVIYQPCITTILSKFEKTHAPSKIKNIGVNIAFDRRHLRFKGKEHDIMTKIASALLSLEKSGYRIRILNHVNTDAQFNLWLKGLNGSFENLNVYGKSYSRVLSAYEDLDLVIGMRGHAQMIPYGLSIPIISLISHNKLQYFLDDIGEPHWGIEVHDENLENKIVNMITNFDVDQAYSSIKKSKEELYDVSQDNLELLRGLI